MILEKSGINLLKPEGHRCLIGFVKMSGGGRKMQAPVYGNVGEAVK